MTSTINGQIDLLRDSLEQQFRLRTEQLTELTVSSQEPGRGGYDAHTLSTLITTSRQAVADTAHALQRMADGTYGICERCADAIPIERLEALPHARFCVSCQRTEAG